MTFAVVLSPAIRATYRLQLVWQSRPMLPQSEPLPAVTRGEKAGRLAAKEMIKTASPETGGLQGVLRQLEAAEIIVAEGHKQAAISAADIRA